MLGPFYGPANCACFRPCHHHKNQVYLRPNACPSNAFVLDLCYPPPLTRFMPHASCLVPHAVLFIFSCCLSGHFPGLGRLLSCFWLLGFMLGFTSVCILARRTESDSFQFLRTNGRFVFHFRFYVASHYVATFFIIISRGFSHLRPIIESFQCVNSISRWLFLLQHRTHRQLYRMSGLFCLFKGITDFD